MEIFLFYQEIVCCVYSLELPQGKILMSILNIPLLSERMKKIPQITAICAWPGVIINPQWLKLSIFWANFYGPRS